MIPQNVLVEFEAYKAGQHPYPFGGFLTAILANDCVGAVLHADENNTKLLREYASYLYNEMPGRTGSAKDDYWGSYEAVANRIKDQKTFKINV